MCKNVGIEAFSNFSFDGGRGRARVALHGEHGRIHRAVGEGVRLRVQDASGTSGRRKGSDRTPQIGQALLPHGPGKELI
jgi:hypothetical protein